MDALGRSAAATTVGAPPEIGTAEFARLSGWLKQEVGIHLTPAKRSLVTSRLARRLREHGCSTFAAYLDLVDRDEGERQAAIDLLTTNETYFFREPKHFEFLQRILPELGASPRIWSAACSTGEEPYSIAMLLDDRLSGKAWELVASDVSSRVLDRARGGVYRLDGLRGLPRTMLERHCLKGTGEQEGLMMVRRRLRQRVAFRQLNLCRPLPDLGRFDMIWLRNVLIYFDQATKAQVAAALARHLRPGGYLLIGHSESLNGIAPGLRMLAPSIYVKA